MLSSPLWNLFYIAVTATMMGYAYYSRHEQTQKLALGILAIWIVSQVVIHTPQMYITYAALDAIGISYAIYLYHQNKMPDVTKVIIWLFACMLVLHVARTDETPWLQYQIAGNLLYLAQLFALSAYGKTYGLEAREHVTPRNDPFYRFLTYARH